MITESENIFGFKTLVKILFLCQDLSLKPIFSFFLIFLSSRREDRAAEFTLTGQRNQTQRDCRILLPGLKLDAEVTYFFSVLNVIP